MIACPTCGADSSVIETRRTPAGARRRRSCDGCGFKFSTIETIVVGKERRPFTEPMSIIRTSDLLEIIRIANGADPVGADEET